MGKSTLIKAIFGLVPVRRGRIRFRGHDITGWDTHRIVAQGLAAIPEGNRVFPRMSVLDNLMAGAYLERSPAKIAARLERVMALLKSPSFPMATPLLAWITAAYCCKMPLSDSSTSVVIRCRR